MGNLRTRQCVDDVVIREDNELTGFKSLDLDLVIFVFFSILYAVYLTDISSTFSREVDQDHNITSSMIYRRG